ncbi:hypothetical protein AG1IA_07547 [Rhizoctonia solani AG-1 IA]|uniref:Uncharacterized protein n=1 Tax=Thanatephorus cucumeris (strain AG1-IA) TaxID=983506 RepID=L8WKH0_THACA|nr:hypothetical protein AG1IA_07547 [Rhizoctonia solani AG-1 IA]
MPSHGLVTLHGHFLSGYEASFSLPRSHLPIFIYAFYAPSMPISLSHLIMFYYFSGSDVVCS